jgi:hypothetical protein
MTKPIEDTIFESFTHSLSKAEYSGAPYPHWMLYGLLPAAMIAEARNLEFPATETGGKSGKRELHNDKRHYFDQENIARHPVMAHIAGAYQAPRMVRAMEDFFGADLEGTFLRIEYAQDVTGFWLEPHSDLGVKRITILHYISDAPGQDDLGTDIYNADKNWAKRTPFVPNAAMAFVPAHNTFHGFAARDIAGVRKSLIVNYVTDEWRDREQLAFPQEKVRRA